MGRRLPDRPKLAEHLQGIGHHLDLAAGPLHGLHLDLGHLEAGLASQPQHLDIEGEAVDSGLAEDPLGRRPPEPLEAALGVTEPQPERAPDGQVEDPTGRPSSNRAAVAPLAEVAPGVLVAPLVVVGLTVVVVAPVLVVALTVVVVAPVQVLRLVSVGRTNREIAKGCSSVRAPSTCTSAMS